MNAANEKLLDDMYAAWRQQDIGRLLSFYTDDCIYEDMAMGVVNAGKDQLRHFVNEVYATMPGFKVVYNHRFATETEGAGEWVITATWNGPFEGVDCSGKPIRFTGLSLYRFRDGKISHAKDCWDYTSMMRGFGVLREDLRSLR